MKNITEIRGCDVALHPYVAEAGMGHPEVFPPSDNEVRELAQQHGIPNETVKRFLRTMTHGKMIRPGNWRDVLLSRRKARKTI